MIEYATNDVVRIAVSFDNQVWKISGKQVG